MIILKQVNQLTQVTIKIAMELGLNTDRAKYDAYFTGWKPCQDGRLVGQLVRWCQRKNQKGLFVAYVNLPGMESGVIPGGACFEIGSERLDEEFGLEEIGALLSAGLGKLTQILNENDDLIPVTE
jgi:hypothetical protein